MTERNTNVCNCRDLYSLEPHGKGYALYFAKCEHRHGYNIANITEPDFHMLNAMLGKFNKKD